MKNLNVRSKPLFLFFLLVIILSVIVDALIITRGTEILYLVVMWVPALAALAANILKGKLSGEKVTLIGFFRGSGFRVCKIRYILLGFLLPLIYLLIPYMIYWKMHPEGFAYSGVSLPLILQDITLPLVLGVFFGLLSAAGEEIGWRGFMLPELLNKNWLNRTLISSSLFWCCWHLPLLIFGDYMAGTPLWYKIPAFILCIFPVGIMAGLLAIKARSMWPAAFLHAAHNNYDQAVFGLLTHGDDSMYFVSETGILTIACAWILAAVMYLAMRKALERKPECDEPDVSKG